MRSVAACVRMGCIIALRKCDGGVRVRDLFSRLVSHTHHLQIKEVQPATAPLQCALSTWLDENVRDSSLVNSKQFNVHGFTAREGWHAVQELKVHGMDGVEHGWSSTPFFSCVGANWSWCGEVLGRTLASKGSRSWEPVGHHDFVAFWEWKSADHATLLERIQAVPDVQSAGLLCSIAQARANFLFRVCASLLLQDTTTICGIVCVRFSTFLLSSATQEPMPQVHCF